jgi:hypothetical protein
MFHGDAADPPVDRLALAGVKPRPHLDTQRVDVLDDRLRAPDGPRRTVERGEEPVAGRVHLPPAEACEERTDTRTMALDERAPRAVAELSRLLGRSHDVGEENGGKHALELVGLASNLAEEVVDCT